MKSIIRWFKNQKKRVKSWWEINQERVKDEVTRVIVIVLMIILSPILIIAIIAMLIMVIEIDIVGLKRIFKKFIERLEEVLKMKRFFSRFWGRVKPVLSEIWRWIAIPITTIRILILILRDKDLRKGLFLDEY